MNTYDRRGKPITLFEYAKKMEDINYKRVAEDKFVLDGEDIHVSTVWLGLNHNYGDGPPIIFETMIFGGKFDQYQTRYATMVDAIKGHNVVCDSVKNGQQPVMPDTNIFEKFFQSMAEEEAGEEWKQDKDDIDELKRLADEAEEFMDEDDEKKDDE